MNWDWLYLLYNLSAIFFIILILARPFMWICSAVSLIFHDSFRFVILTLISGVPYYFMVAFSVISVLSLKENPGIGWFSLSGIFLLCVIFIGNVNSITEAQKANDIVLLKSISIRWYIMWGMMVFYIYACFNPNVVVNDWVISISNLIDWVNGIIFLRWIVAGAAIIYMIYYLITGFLISITYFTNWMTRGEKDRLYEVKK